MTAQQNRLFHGKALPTRYSWKPAISILSWFFAFQSCAGHMHHFARCLLTSYLRKHFYLQLLESSHSLFLTQPLQLNPTINTGYNRLNKIIIKFGTKLKPTKHIVVNYNFTKTSQDYISIYVLWWFEIWGNQLNSHTVITIWWGLSPSKYIL